MEAENFLINSKINSLTHLGNTSPLQWEITSASKVYGRNAFKSLSDVDCFPSSWTTENGVWGKGTSCNAVVPGVQITVVSRELRAYSKTGSETMVHGPTAGGPQRAAGLNAYSSLSIDYTGDWLRLRRLIITSEASTPP